MATETDETYFRKYLLDPASVQNAPAQQQPSAPEATDNNVDYYRKYLNDTSNA